MPDTPARGRRIHCIGIASNLGAPGPGPEAGPNALQIAGFAEALLAHGLTASWSDFIYADTQKSPESINGFLRMVADAAAAAVGQGALPILIGGDHLQAAGTWRGIGRALDHAPGLIWIDAHLDAHTPSTTESGNLHGMPLAALLGLGAIETTRIDGPPLEPNRIAVIGVRSHEAAELALMEKLGVRIFSMGDIHRLGLPAVFEQARQISGAEAGLPYGISLDLDAIDPSDAPAVLVPVPGGIAGRELARQLQGCLHETNCVGLEIVEYCPPHDIQERTAALVIELAEAAAQPPGRQPAGAVASG